MSKKHEIRVMVSKEHKDIVQSLSKKLGIKQSELCGIWMEMIDPGNKELIERVIHIKAVNEVNRLSQTRNALMARLRRKGVLNRMDNMSLEEVEAFIKQLAKRK